MTGKLRRRAARAKGVLVLARRIAGLGPGRVARARLFVVTLALGARWILRRPSARLRTLTVCLGGVTRDLVVSDYGELQVLRDIALDEEYAVAAGEPRTIVDLGANIGIAAAWFRSRYPEAMIVAVEPDPDSFAKLERNLAGDRLITLVNAAVGASNGTRTLFRPAGYSIASSLDPGGGEPGSEVAVPVRTLDDILAGEGVRQIDLLKLDVEGAEGDALEGFTRLDDLELLLGEVHPRLLAEGADAFFARLLAFEVERGAETADAISFVARRRA